MTTSPPVPMMVRLERVLPAPRTASTGPGSIPSWFGAGWRRRR